MDIRYVKTFVLAVLVGLLGGIQGQAGALYILSGLLMFNIVKSQDIAAGTALLYTSVPVTLGAAYEYYKRGKIDLKVSIILIPTVIVFSVLGAKLNPYVPKKYILYSIGLTSLIISIYFFYKGYYEKISTT
jgi:uncharacterized membrane protein YfcA